jgi:hypothetical protein
MRVVLQETGEQLGVAAGECGHEAFVLAHGFGPARIGKVGEVARAFDFSSETGIGVRKRLIAGEISDALMGMTWFNSK